MTDYDATLYPYNVLYADDYAARDTIYTYYDMRGVETGALGAKTIRYWSVKDSPDFEAMYYPNPTYMDNPLTDVVIVRKYKDTKNIAATALNSLPQVGLQFRYDFTDSSTLFSDGSRTTLAGNGVVVRGVTDLSGNNNHATVGVGGPTNNLSGISFSGAASEAMQTGNITIAKPGLTSIVVANHSGSTGYIFYVPGTTGFSYLYKPTGYSALSYDGTLQDPINASLIWTQPTGNTLYIHRQSQTSSLNVFVNGLKYGKGNASSPPKFSSTGSWYLGGNNTGSYPSQMTCKCWIGYDRELTNDEVQQITRWIRNKYGTP